MYEIAYQPTGYHIIGERRTSGGHAICNVQVVPDLKRTREAHREPQRVQVGADDLRRLDLDDERAARWR